jgi:undecaprenyl pyrophosphate phosphatase UppP
MTARPEMPAYGEPSNIRPDRLGWPRVITRMLLLVLPGQLVGSFTAITALQGSGVLRDRPGLAVLIAVLAGLVPGVALGLLLRPHRSQLLGYAVVGAGMAVAVLLLLLGLAELRRPDIAPRASLGAYLRNLVIVAVVQSAAAIPLWLARGRATQPSAPRPTGRIGG